MEIRIFEAINGLVGRYGRLDLLGVLFSSYAGYALVSAALVFLAAKFSKKNLAMVWWALVSAAVAKVIIAELIRFFYNRPRPFEVLDIIQLVSHSPTQSFPSGHASFFFAFGTALFFYNKLLGKIFLVVALLIGVARVYVGIHWPSDVLAGAAIGIAVSFLINRLVSKLKLPLAGRS